jgi:hypothetical protein
MSNLEEMQAFASLFKKKAAVMAALEGGMAKDGTNEHFKYKFMSASSIKHAVGHLFAIHGIALKMGGIATENAVSSVTNSKGETKNVPILRIQFSISLCDVDTGAVDESFWFGEAGATDDKAASKAATSALKYFLISNLMIGDKEEDARDTDNQKRPVKKSESAPSQSPISPTGDKAFWDRLKARFAESLNEANQDRAVNAMRKMYAAKQISTSMSEADVFNAVITNTFKDGELLEDDVAIAYAEKQGRR